MDTEGFNAWLERERAKRPLAMIGPREADLMARAWNAALYAAGNICESGDGVVPTGGIEDVACWALGSDYARVILALETEVYT